MDATAAETAAAPQAPVRTAADAVSRYHLALAWTGPAAIVIVLTGWCALAGFLPPPPANVSPERAVGVFRHHTDLKRLGLMMSFWGGCLYVTFALAIALTLRRAGPGGWVLGATQLLFGMFAIAFFAWNFLMLAAVAFRPEGSAVALRPLVDVGFIMTFASVAPFCLQYTVIGIAILQDPADDPVIPRWVGYLNFWVAILLIPAGCIPFFRHGPVAWNGLLSFYVAVGVFAIWFGAMFWAVRRRLVGSRASVGATSCDIGSAHGVRIRVPSAAGEPAVEAADVEGEPRT